MRKGVAVPYIIALILGIVVVALIGYWFFVMGGGLPGQKSIQSCNVVLQKYCREWSLYNFDLGAPGDKFAEWDEDPAYLGSKGCKDLGVTASKQICQTLFGIIPGTTTPAGEEGTVGSLGQPCKPDDTCDVGVCCTEDTGKFCRVACA